jgi:Holliday junction resolvase
MADKRTDQVFAYIRDVWDLKTEDIEALDTEAFIEKVKRVHKGLSAEHEFAAIAAWLGKCSLITQLDSALHSSDHYRVPDFLAVVKRKGKDVPFLVEVKTDHDDKLDWRPDYLELLQAFATMMRLPLLIAWKHHGLWVLTDSARFTKKVTNYHLTFDDAVKNSLMSELFGNHWIAFAEGFRLELKMRIQDEIDATVELLPEGGYNMVIEAAGVWTNKGRLNKEDERSLWWFLIAAMDGEEFSRDGYIITQQFPAKSEGMFNLSDVLMSQLVWNKGDRDSIDWLMEIRKGLPVPPADLDHILQRALDLGAVHYVLRQAPQEVPSFLRQGQGSV